MTADKGDERLRAADFCPYGFDADGAPRPDHRGNVSVERVALIEQFYTPPSAEAGESYGTRGYVVALPTGVLSWANEGSLRLVAASPPQPAPDPELTPSGVTQDSIASDG